MKYLDQSVKMLVKRIFSASLFHPFRHERSPPRNYPQFSTLSFQECKSPRCYAAVKRKVVYAHSAVILYSCKYLFLRNITNIFLISNCFAENLVERDSTYWYRASFHYSAQY